MHLSSKYSPRHQQLYIPKVVSKTSFTHSKRPAINFNGFTVMANSADYSAPET
jgi:hypothetical protein